MAGLPESTLRYQPRVIAAPISPQLPFWVACKNISPDELRGRKFFQQKEEFWIEISLAERNAGPSPLEEAIFSSIDNYQKEEFLLADTTIKLGPKPQIVGILNLTPDSFFQGSRMASTTQALEKAKEMLCDGADWIDVGGESTRPGSTPVSAQEEIDRILPTIGAIHREFPRTPISIDTMKAEVADAALSAGASIINDVSGLEADGRMTEIAVKHNAPIVLNHMRGTPQSMQESPSYINPVEEVIQELRERVDRGLRAGISPNRIILDPGIGFGKRPSDNLQILGRLHEFRSLGMPLFIGVSRKAFIGKILEDRPSEQRLFGTSAAVAAAVLGGAKLLRVHDPKEMKDVVRVAAAIAKGTEKE